MDRLPVKTSVIPVKRKQGRSKMDHEGTTSSSVSHEFSAMKSIGMGLKVKMVRDDDIDRLAQESGRKPTFVTIPTTYDHPIASGSWLFFVRSKLRERLHEPHIDRREEVTPHESKTVTPEKTPPKRKSRNRYLKEIVSDLQDVQPARLKRKSVKVRSFQYCDLEGTKPRRRRTNPKPQFAFKLDFLDDSGGGPRAKIEIQLIKGSVGIEKFMERALVCDKSICWVSSAEPAANVLEQLPTAMTCAEYRMADVDNELAALTEAMEDLPSLDVDHDDYADLSPPVPAHSDEPEPAPAVASVGGEDKFSFSSGSESVDPPLVKPNPESAASEACNSANEKGDEDKFLLGRQSIDIPLCERDLVDSGVCNLLADNNVPQVDNCEGNSPSSRALDSPIIHLGYSSEEDLTDAEELYTNTREKIDKFSASNIVHLDSSNSQFNSGNDDKSKNTADIDPAQKINWGTDDETEVDPNPRDRLSLYLKSDTTPLVERYRVDKRYGERNKTKRLKKCVKRPKSISSKSKFLSVMDAINQALDLSNFKTESTVCTPTVERESTPTCDSPTSDSEQDDF